MWLPLVEDSLAADPPAAEAREEEEAPPEKRRTMRLYLGGGQGTSGTTAYPTFSLGFHSLTRGRHIAGGVGGALQLVQIDAVRLPLIQIDGVVRAIPFPDAPVIPYLSGNLGLSMLLIIPFPQLGVGLGAEIPVGDELRLEGELHARYVFPLWDADPVTIAELRVGVAF